jgi:putative endonuclease
MMIERVYVYILKSAEDSFYCGIMNNLIRRTEEHNIGMSRYTRRWKGWKVVWSELLESRVQARQMEVKIKNCGVRKYYLKHARPRSEKPTPAQAGTVTVTVTVTVTKTTGGRGRALAHPLRSLSVSPVSLSSRPTA